MGQRMLYIILRIIPTRVGTSANNTFLQALRRDHPHACGDKEIAMRLRTAQEGSSPRVWGQEIFKLYDTMAIRIIPTRVGTRNNSFFVYLTFRDHPHACGDKRIPIMVKALQ